MTEVEHELGFLEFVERKQARRVRELLQSGEKGRRKLYEMMSHSLCLDQRYAFPIEPRNQTVPHILAQLVSSGAKEKAYLIAEESPGKELDLKTILEENLGSGQSFYVSCLPGRLAYYEYEEAGQRYILKRSLRASPKP